MSGPVCADDVAATLRHPLKPGAAVEPPATLRMPCPPSVGPVLPNTQPSQPTPPQVDAPATIAPPSIDPLARAPELGGNPSATINPNMFGDLFGARRLQFSQSRTVFNSRRLDYVLEGPVVGNTNPGTQQVFPRVVFIPQTVSGVDTLVPTTQQPFTFVFDNGGVRRVASPSFVPFGTVVNNTIPVNEGPTITSAVRSLNPGASVSFLQGRAIQSTSPQSNAIFVQQSYAIETTETFIDRFDLINPSAGGIVGRTKVSEDNYPMPRDRVFLGADWFGNTTLQPGGFDVARFAPGVEWTFLEQRMSIEARLPFASTVDNIAGPAMAVGRATSIGNLHLTLKALALRGEEWNIATGFGLGVPTGPDSVIRTSDGADLIRLTNDSWTITPYIAALWTPNDRWFAQGWLQLGLDPIGNRTFVDGSLAGRIYDQALFQSDLQLGYWMVRNERDSMLRGLAPFVELHFNAPLTDAGSVALSNTQIASGDNRYSDLSVTLGATAQIGSDLLVSAGLVLPLRPEGERSFDYQLGLRASWYFGPSSNDDRLLTSPALTGDTIAPGTSGTVINTPAEVDLLARAPELGAQPAATFNPGMFGDFAGILSRSRRGTSAPLTTTYQGIKVADLGGPRPVDRFWYGHNRYTEAGGSNGRLARQTLGGELAIGQRFGLGARLPVTDLSTSGRGRDVGDITLVGKYTLLEDEHSSDMIGTGAAITLPSGDRIAGLPRSVLIQPWLGGTFSSGEWFVQSMSSVVLPTDPTYPVALFGSVGAGYWVYRCPTDSLVRGIAPVVELHGSVPLTNRRGAATTFFNDQLNLTVGAYVELPRVTIGTAIAVPLLTPRPFSTEAIVSIGYRF